MKNLGIIVDRVAAEQAGYKICWNVNKIIKNYKDIYPTVFYHNYSKPPFAMDFPIMQDVNAWNFYGPMISTSLITTERMLRYIATTDMYFYVWDLEWLTGGSLYFSYLSNLYNNPKINLIARSDEHNKILTRTWKKPIAVIKEFDYEHIASFAA